MGIMPPPGKIGGTIMVLGIMDMAGRVGGSAELVRPGRLGRPGSGGRDSGPVGEVGRDSRLPAL